MNDFAKNRERNPDGTFMKSSKLSTFNKNQYYKDYYQRNKERKLKIALEWSRRNKERRKIIKDRWRAKNKNRTNYLTRMYHYRKKNADGFTSFEDIKWLYEKCGGHCMYCNVNKATTIDHIIPLTRGGTNNIDNLLPVCVSCNSKKGAKTLLEWNPMKYIEFYQIAKHNHGYSK